jgi:hypothetical protein
MIVNTKDKTIQLQDETLGEVFDQVQQMLPDNWKEYKVLTTNPTIIQKEIVREVQPYREIPYQPYYPDDPYNPWKITFTDITTYGDPSKFGTFYKNNEAIDFINKMREDGWIYGGSTTYSVEA